MEPVVGLADQRPGHGPQQKGSGPAGLRPPVPVFARSRLPGRNGAVQGVD